MSVLWMMLAPLALAAPSKFEGTAKPPEEKPDTSEYTASVELGGAVVSGNSESYAINGAARGSARWSNNKLSAFATINRGSARVDQDGDGRLDDQERAAPMVRTVERYQTQARYDRFIGEKDSLYVLAGAFRDTFAGFDLRSNQQFGYSRTLVKNDDTTLVAEIGFDYAQENYVPDVDPGYADIFAARLMLGVSHKFNENVSFTNTLEAFENVVDPADLRVLNTGTLSAGLSSRLSLKLSHALIFDNVPVEGYRKLDQTTLITLVATLL